MPSYYPLLAQIKRANSIESQHFGFWAFFSVGNFQVAHSEDSSKDFLEEYVCLRSVAKLFQTLTCLRLGLSLNDEQVAISTSSHSGSNEHVEKVGALLNHFELDWHNLQCGEHPPIDRETQYSAFGSVQRRLQNNCSGKHSMMLAVCNLKGWELQNYLSPHHPLQQQVLKTICELCEITTEKVSVALDGCGLPTYTLPVKNILLGFSKFTINSTDSNIQQIARALLHHSGLVSGNKRLDHELTLICSPQLISKSGAGGITAISFQGNLTGALLVKLCDTDEKARALVIKKLLQKFEIAHSDLFSQNLLFAESINNLHGQQAAEIELFV